MNKASFDIIRKVLFKTGDAIVILTAILFSGIQVVYFVPWFSCCRHCSISSVQMWPRGKGQ